MNFKTPGVYIREISLFPPSVAQVETAIPAFIGYTEKAVDLDGNDLTGKPKKIKSLVEHELYYGFDFDPVDYQITLTGNQITGINVKKLFLYKSLKAFYENGGGVCYVVSVGSYDDDVALEVAGNNDKGLKAGLASLEKFDEPTIILFPDAVAIDEDGDYFLSDAATLGALHQATLAQCNKLQDRFGVFDIMNSLSGSEVNLDQSLEDFRNSIGSINLKYGAAYFPWIRSTYQQKFRLRNVVDGADTPVLDLPATPSDILTELKAEISRVNKILATLNTAPHGALDLKAFSDLPLFYNDLTRGLKKANTVNNEFLNILILLRRSVLAFRTLETDNTLGADLAGKIATIKADKTIKDQILYLIKLEKSIAGEEISDQADGDAVSATYAALDANAVWLDGTSESHANVGAIGTLAGLTLAGDKKAKALAAMVHMDDNLDADLLLGAVQQIFETALSNEESKEQQLINQDPFFRNISNVIKQEMGLLPPSGFVAGVYATVDRTRGVWKAPANISLNSVVAPHIKISNEEQQDMNVHTSGKSVNAIRAFAGKGVLVWGARTLAGNDNEWRYISVRRFYNMVEESVKKATEQFVFENNDANTWVKVRSMIRNYLTVLWRQGALAGATTDDAFYISIGLGETMTAVDILEGRMIVEIGLAVVRPAEFIILRFTHKMIEA
jgi:uncharacterized protein